MGKLQADVQEVVGALAEQDFAVLAITSAHLQTLAMLPTYPDHRDPFDHLLIAQAITEGATFMSADRHTPRYKVQFVTCSDPPAVDMSGDAG